MPVKPVVEAPSAGGDVKVWDPLVRIFHWSLFVAFFIAYFTEDDLLDIHVWAGYTVLGLLVFRVFWGFVGPGHARFSDFVVSPGQVLSYFKAVLTLSAPRHIGHNPAGGAMIILLLLGLLGATVSGLFLYGADQGAGPLAGLMASVAESTEDFLEAVHEFFANFTLALVAIHVIGVIWESMLHKENLVRAMITGRKRR